MNERGELIEEARASMRRGLRADDAGSWREIDPQDEIATAMADFALKHFGIYREICEAASFIYFGDMRIMCLLDGKYEAVNTQRPMRNPRVFCTLAEAFEWVKGGRR